MISTLFRCRWASLLLAPALVLSGCASGYESIPLSRANAGVDGQYRLGPGDMVHLTVYGEPDLSGDFEVAGNGQVSLPLAGDIKASGLTPPQFGGAVRAKLAGGLVLDPRVAVEVKTFRPYYILGEVAKPGEYPYSNRLSVFQAVARAGGFTARANKGHVVLKRDGWPSARSVTMEGDALLIAPGDTIYVQEAAF